MLRSSHKSSSVNAATRCLWKIHSRFFSSRGGSDRASSFRNVYGLKFSVSPEEAIGKFDAWAASEGLSWIASSRRGISAAYCPVYSFDINLRFKQGAKPELFHVYRTSTVHIPGMSIYAGYSYRRSLIDPLHNASLMFMREQLLPFQNFMLRDMKLEDGTTLQVSPDPWNATKLRALSILKENLDELVQAENPEGRYRMQLIRTTRVYMPTYVITYRILGMEYRAFISGCDDGAPVSAVSHKVMDWSWTRSAWVGAATREVLRDRQVQSAFIVALQLMGNVLARIATRIPLIGAVAGAVVGFRKVVQPWMDNRAASAEWERQREHEARMKDTFVFRNDFVDDGTAEKYFRTHRSTILRHLNGDQGRREGDFDWYQEWEEWARRQWAQQQQQQYSQGQTQQQQQRRRTTQSSRTKRDFQWDFNPNDP